MRWTTRCCYGHLLLSLAAVVLLLSNGSAALLCHCTYGLGCDLKTSTCWTKDSSACMTFAYRVDGEVIKTFFCSDSGLECPRPGDPPASGSSESFCCKYDHCNREIDGQTPPPPPTTPPSSTTTSTPTIATTLDQASPQVGTAATAHPRSVGRLRCDCSLGASGGCRQDRGKRGHAHCTVENGWCVTVATRILFLPWVNIRYTRYCTTEQDVCEAGRDLQTSVKCCSDSRFCNEKLRPTFDKEVVDIPTTPYKVVTPTFDGGLVDRGSGVDPTPDNETASVSTRSPPAGSSKIWCHCNSRQQCNVSFPFCQTSGKCQEVAGFLPVFDVQRCVETYDDALCTASNPCCENDCCNGKGQCKPDVRVPPTEPVKATGLSPGTRMYKCHCTNCVDTHQCTTQHGCKVDVDTLTNTSIQDCVRTASLRQVHCSPSFPRSSAQAVARAIGKVSTYCCLGDNCNEVHPSHPHLVAEKRLVCRCVAKHCSGSGNLCYTNGNGGFCYSGGEGQFCIHPKETELKNRLCGEGDDAGAGRCCNSPSLCNDLVSVVASEAVLSTSPSIGQTSAVQPANQQSSGVTVKFDALYIGIAVTVFLVLCMVLLAVLIVSSRYIKRRKQQQHPQQQQQYGRENSYHGHPGNLVARPTSLPKSTFDVSPVLTKLSAWQASQELLADELAPVSITTAITPAEQSSLMCKAHSTSVSTSNSSISDTTGVTTASLCSPEESSDQQDSTAGRKSPRIAPDETDL